MDPKKPNKPPQIAKGPRAVPSVESVYKGAPMRSLFEVRFAKLLDARAIAWEYEPERLQGGRYLVDFHLPDLKCWVEVKGRFEARDEMLLPLVARHLRVERGERLFLFMKRRAYHITGRGFAEMRHETFWTMIQAAPEDADSGDDDDSAAKPAKPAPSDDLRLPDRSKRRSRRPWDR